MLNQVVIMGRLTRDPELRKTQSGLSVVSVGLAVERDWKPEGQEKREVDFVEVVAWRGTADFLKKYFSKGRMVCIHGRLQVRDWKDKDGAKRRSVEVVAEDVYFADSRKQETGAGVVEPAGNAADVSADEPDFPF